MNKFLSLIACILTVTIQYKPIVCLQQAASSNQENSHVGLTSLPQILSSYLQVSPDKIFVNPLAGGTSAASIFFVQASAKQYVLRIQPDDLSQDQRARELYMMKQAAALGVAPQIYYVAHDTSFVLMDFVQGDTITIDLVKEPENCVKIAAALRAIHATNRNPHGDISIQDRIEQYFSALPLNIRNMPVVCDSVAMARSAHKKLSVRPKVNVHGDLSSRNIFIIHDKIQLIDWEATSWDDQFFDVAYFAATHNYTTGEEAILLNAYLQHIPSQEEMDSYILNKRIALVYYCVWCLSLMTDLYDKGQTVDYARPPVSWSSCVQDFAATKGASVSAQDLYNAAMAALQEAGK